MTYICVFILFTLTSISKSYDLTLSITPESEG